MLFNKLIIIRGPSSSGKTTTARKLRDRLDGKVALIEQDYIRRVLLKEKDRPGAVNIDLILKITQHALESNFSVILEGVLYAKHYREMLYRLVSEYMGSSYCYYFNLSFDETLARYRGSPKVDRFSEDDLREWYTPNDFLGICDEVALLGNQDRETVLSRILNDVKA